MYAGGSARTQPVERFFQVSLLGLLASGYLAVVASGTLDLPTTVLTAAALIVRALMIAGFVQLHIPDRWVAAISLAYIGFYPIDYLFISESFLQATVHFIFLLAILRVLSARSERDYSFVKLIAFMELLAASVLSIDLSFFTFMIAFLIFGVATFASSEIRRGLQTSTRVVRLPAPRFHGRLSALVAAASLAIVVFTGALFFLLPRTAQAAFRHLVSQRYHLPGFSNEVVLGQLGEIKQQSRTVMHIRLDGPSRGADLKWRGAAMSEFDGRRWYNSERSSEAMRMEKGGLVPLGEAPVRYQTPSLTYEVRINNLDTDAIFLTGKPQYLRTNLRQILRSAGDSFRTGLAGGSGIHYFGLSEDRRAGNRSITHTALPPGYRELNLLLPPIDIRVAKLAQDTVAGEKTAFGRAAALERYLKTSYGYTAELLSESVQDPIAHFLLERKKGHCEYFASAMAVMLRYVGVPARIVTGFQSGIYNDLTGWHLIRTTDAHSWVEAWIDGAGWTTFDPTPPDPRAMRAGVLHKLSLYMDAAETFWQEWVVNYDLERQITLASHVESKGRLKSIDWLARLQISGKRAASLAKEALAPGAGLILIGIMAWTCGPSCWRWWNGRERNRRYRAGQVTSNDATLLYTRMLRLLAKRGYEKPAWLTPSEFARVLPAASVAPVVREFTASYNDLRFGGRREAGRQMLELLDQLEAMPKQ